MWSISIKKEHWNHTQKYIQHNNKKCWQYILKSLLKVLKHSNCGTPIRAENLKTANVLKHLCVTYHLTTYVLSYTYQSPLQYSYGLIMFLYLTLIHSFYNLSIIFTFKFLNLRNIDSCNIFGFFAVHNIIKILLLINLINCTILVIVHNK